jgi:Uma2 family endonuclease
MTDQILANPVAVETPPPPAYEPRPSGEILAEGMSFEEYAHTYAELGHEWVRGYVVKMAAISMRHQWIIDFLADLLRTYFVLRPIGQIASHKFLMKLDKARSGREPDIMVILNENPNKLIETMLLGAADICIEVVSPTSVARDYDEKYQEYETAGVREYWILDYRRQVADFHRLNAEGKYERVMPTDDNTYTTPLLPDLRLHVPTLWEDMLPDIIMTVQSVQQMLQDSTK